MTAIAVRDLRQAMTDVRLRIRPSPTRRSDAEVGIAELRAYRGDLDLVSLPSRVASEPLVQAYRGRVTSGDHLRLPRRTNLHGFEMQRALDRVLAVDVEGAGGSAEQVAAAARMQHVLGELRSAVDQIRRQMAPVREG